MSKSSAYIAHWGNNYNFAQILRIGEINTILRIYCALGRESCANIAHKISLCNYCASNAPLAHLVQNTISHQSVLQIRMQLLKAIFVSLHARAHEEACESLNISFFRLLFRRYCSRRRLPMLLISDNASTFKSGEKEIRKIVRSREVKNYLANKAIKWTFITLRASWMGGTWERMVSQRSVKRCLKKMLGKSLLTFRELQTISCKIEAVLNDRPITYCYDDEGGHILSPHSF